MEKVTRKKHLWIPLTLMLLASIAMVNIPVKADPYETRLYIRESPPGEWISAGDVGSTFFVIVDIESPIAWDDTVNGIVGWEFSVHVDPNVLGLYGSAAYSADMGYFMFDYVDWHGYTAQSMQFLIDEVNATSGDIYRAGEMMLGYELLGKGPGGNSEPGWYGEDYGLCRLRFEKLSETGYTLIDIYDAYWVDMNGDKHAFDVVDDGQYNQEPAYLTVESTPINYTDFTIDSTAYTTNTTIELQPDTYTVTMPNPTIFEGDQFSFVEWENANTNPVRDITLASNDAVTIIATYAYAGPPLEANLVGRSGWKEHAHFDVSKHGNTSVTDPKGTSGYQTLFAKIKNIGEGDVLVRAKFELVIGVTPADEFPMITTENMTVPGEIIILTVDFAGKDGYPWETEDEDTWKMRVICEYYVPAVGWLEGTKIKTSKFNVVP